MWKLALHSVSYAGVWEGQAALSLEEFLDHAAELGYQGVMLMAKGRHASLLAMPEDRRRAIRDQMQRRGLELAALAAYNDFTLGVERPDIPLVEMQALYIRECARLTRDLGGRIVRIFTGYERSELTPAQSWSRCVKAVKECARQAADYDVTLAVQNHHDVAVHYEALRDFLTEVDEPNVKAGYDAWAPTLQGLSGEPLAEAVRRLAPFLVQTIVADYVLQPRFHYNPALTNYTPAQAEAKAVPVGEGIIDYASFFAALREIGYTGFVTYEMCSALRGGGSLENLDRYARRFLHWMEPFQPA
ncbi:MAG TPA: sugar phosphate isomerase/epimerase family protein [Chthonomonadaceae bacterium]|nr:sugar phosphate isomerase/epimerase family protein [Chthonomonadaceae bacterium]